MATKKRKSSTTKSKSNTTKRKSSNSKRKSNPSVKKKRISKSKPKSNTKTKKKSTRKSPKYGKGSQTEVKREMHRFKKGTAHSGPKHKTVKSREQAIAIALSKARNKGIKVPKKSK